MPQDNRNLPLSVRGLLSAVQKPNTVTTEMQDLLGGIANPNRPHRWGEGKPAENLSQIQMGDLMVPRPEGFVQDPISPGTDMSVALQALHKIAPALKGNVDRVQMSPTRSVMHDLTASGIPDEKFENTNLLGEYGPNDGEIYVSPRTERNMLPGGLVKTLVHELAHTTGLGHNRQMENLEGLSIMMQDAQGLKEGQTMDKAGAWHQDPADAALSNKYFDEFRTSPEPLVRDLIKAFNARGKR